LLWDFGHVDTSICVWYQGTTEEAFELYASQKSLSYRNYSAEKYQHWQLAYYIKNPTVWRPNKCSCKTCMDIIPHLPKL